MSSSRTCSSHPITNIDDLVTSQFGHRIVSERWPSGKQKHINRLEKIMYSEPWGPPSERTRRKNWKKRWDWSMTDSELDELRYWRREMATEEDHYRLMEDLMEEEEFHKERQEERAVEMNRQARQKGRMSVL